MGRVVQGFLLATSVFLFFCGVGSAGEIDKMSLSQGNREVTSRPVQRGMGGERSGRKDSHAMRRGYGRNVPEYAGRNHYGQMNPGNGTRQGYGRDRLRRNDPNQRGRIGGKDYQHRIYGRNIPGYDGQNRHGRTDERRHGPEKKYGREMYGHDGRKPYGHTGKRNYPGQIYGRPYGMSDKNGSAKCRENDHRPWCKSPSSVLKTGEIGRPEDRPNKHCRKNDPRPWCKSPLPVPNPVNVQDNSYQIDNDVAAVTDSVADNAITDDTTSDTYTTDVYTDNDSYVYESDTSEADKQARRNETIQQVGSAITQVLGGISNFFNGNNNNNNGNAVNGSINSDAGLYPGGEYANGSSPDDSTVTGHSQKVDSDVQETAESSSSQSDADFMN